MNEFELDVTEGTEEDIRENLADVRLNGTKVEDEDNEFGPTDVDLEEIKLNK